MQLTTRTNSTLFLESMVAVEVDSAPEDGEIFDTFIVYPESVILDSVEQINPDEFAVSVAWGVRKGTFTLASTQFEKIAVVEPELVMGR